MLKSVKHHDDNKTEIHITNNPAGLLLFLNKKKKHLNKLIDDFEGLAFRLRKEISSGIDQEKIEDYRKKLNLINEKIINQRKIITELEAEVEKIEVLQG